MSTLLHLHIDIDISHLRGQMGTFLPYAKAHPGTCGVYAGLQTGEVMVQGMRRSLRCEIDGEQFGHVSSEVVHWPECNCPFSALRLKDVQVVDRLMHARAWDTLMWTTKRGWRSDAPVSSVGLRTVCDDPLSVEECTSHSLPCLPDDHPTHLHIATERRSSKRVWSHSTHEHISSSLSRPSHDAGFDAFVAGTEAGSGICACSMSVSAFHQRVGPCVQ